MSGNPLLTFSSFSTDFYALPSRQLLRLFGAQALEFAQAQFTNDVRTLTDGQWQWSAWLNVKGRVIAIFQLLRLDQQNVLLLSCDDNAAELAQSLRGFVFRRKVLITLETVHINAAFRAAELASSANLAQLSNGAIELDMGSPTQPRALRLIFDHSAEKKDKENPHFTLAWQQANLAFGLPYLAASQSQQWTVQQLGLERLAAYSVKKGCYPGQEILARTHFLGKAKRSLYLLELSASALPGTPVTAQGKDIGTVVSSAGLLALAVLPVAHDFTAPMQVNNQPAKRISLCDGLGR